MGIRLPPDYGAQVRRIRRETGFPVGWLITPATLWLLVFLVLPLVSIVVFSFWSATGHGMKPDLTLQYYQEYFVTDGFFDPESRDFWKPSVFIRTLGSTFYTTIIVMAFCLLLV